MLRTAEHMKDLTIHASDGEFGSVQHFFFDDETWAIRYMVVDTGKWLARHLVLIAPIFIQRVDWENKELHLQLTKAQIEHSPDIDTQQPVSRQHEAEYMDYFCAPYYWEGSSMWGMWMYPGDLLGAQMPLSGAPGTPLPGAADSHLRSIQALSGYRIDSADGEIGHVIDFLIDQDTWAIRYLEINTRNWLPGKKVLISPDWVAEVSWETSAISISLPRESVASAPEYIESRPFTRDEEARLHEHYRIAPYWVRETGHTLSARS